MLEIDEELQPYFARFERHKRERAALNQLPLYLRNQLFDVKDGFDLDGDDALAERRRNFNRFHIDNWLILGGSAQVPQDIIREGPLRSYLSNHATATVIAMDEYVKQNNEHKDEYELFTCTIHDTDVDRSPFAQTYDPFTYPDSLPSISSLSLGKRRASSAPAGKQPASKRQDRREGPEDEDSSDEDTPDDDLRIDPHLLRCTAQIRRELEVPVKEMTTSMRLMLLFFNFADFLKRLDRFVDKRNPETFEFPGPDAFEGTNLESEELRIEYLFQRLWNDLLRSRALFTHPEATYLNRLPDQLLGEPPAVNVNWKKLQSLTVAAYSLLMIEQKKIPPHGNSDFQRYQSGPGFYWIWRARRDVLLALTTAVQSAACTGWMDSDQALPTGYVAPPGPRRYTTMMENMARHRTKVFDCMADVSNGLRIVCFIKNRISTLTFSPVRHGYDDASQPYFAATLLQGGRIRGTIIQKPCGRHGGRKTPVAIRPAS